MLDLNLFESNGTEPDGIEIEEVSRRDIAVIGMAVRMPAADTLDEFWENIRSGKNCITDFPDSRRTDTEQYLRSQGMSGKSGRYNKGAYLEDIDKFDCGFFQISPNEANLMAPNQRLFLQVAWKAIEDGGYGGRKLSNTKTGVYVGYNADAPFTYKNYLSDIDPSLLPIAMPGNLTSIIAGRISYILNLRGPSLVVDTACSSSLIAIHLACKAIRNGECDMALAGGIKLDMLPLEREYKLGIESSDGRTKTFDDSSDGTGMGEGAAAVLLKPLNKALKDGDYVYAVIKGSAANQDGSTIGITAPNVEAQEQVILDAWHDSGIDPGTITYIEAHGTGTKLGDPIEVDGITRAFKRHTSRKQFCAISSLKTNIGHLDNASGIASFVKAVLSLKHKELAPALNFKRPNANIPFFDSPVYVNDRLMKWETGENPLRCGVSAFGLSGTNCHIVLEGAPPIERKSDDKDLELKIFTLSAKTRDGFSSQVEEYRRFIKGKCSLNIGNICYTANTGRGHYNIRMALLVKNMKDLAGKLEKIDLQDLASNHSEAEGIFFREYDASGTGKETKGGVQREGGTGEPGCEAGEPDESGYEAGALVKEIRENFSHNTGKLVELCRSYINGLSVNWEELYQNQNMHKLPLPTYIFDKKRCWVKTSEIAVKTVIEHFNKIKLSGRSSGEYSHTEKCVASAWAASLGFDEVDIYSNFYDLGGDSIIAMRIANILNENSNVKAEIADILRHLTIEAFSKYYDTKSIAEKSIAEKSLAGGNAKVAGTMIPCAEEMEFYPVSSSQRRMYIINQADREDLSYNIPGVFLIDGRLDGNKIEECFNALVRRHQALRTEFVLVDGEPVQKIIGDVQLKTELFNTEQINTGSSDIDTVIRLFVRPFDVEKAPLIRLGLAHLSDGRSVLMLDMHHIISDGVSADILIREFSQLYTGIELPELRLQYKDFSVWHNEFVKSDYVKKQGEYWKGVFSKGIPVLEMPYDFARPSEKAYKGGKTLHIIEEETVGKLKKLARDHNITMNTLFVSFYALLLCRYSGQKTVAIGTIVSGRHYKDIENIIGIFINYLPVCCSLDEACSFSEYFQQVGTNIIKAVENQDYPYDRLVEDLNIKVDAARNPLFDTMLVYHNEFQADRSIEIGDTVFRKQETGFSSSTLDLKLDIIEIKDGTLECRFEYNSLLFREDTANDIACWFQSIIRFAADETGKRIEEFELFSEEERKKIGQKKALLAKKQIQAVNLAVAATFTAEPVEDYIKWWCGEFGINARVRFASYNQVFQELLDQDSILSSNSGINLLLVRFEDWIRDDRSDGDELYRKLENNFAELLTVLRDKPKQIPYLAGIFPISTHTGFSSRITGLLEDLTSRWRNELSHMQNVYVADFTGIAELYSIAEIFDPIKDREGHLPFSDGYYAAMGTEIARKLCALGKQQFKVIVLDCDNTLWKGVCGEDGALSVSVTGSYVELQRFMLQKYNEGMLLALCSKNNEADVWEVFDRNTQMVLKKEHFAAWRINWNPKHDNIRELAKELNLGLDSFIFMDDSPVECSGMFFACPEVLTLQLPEHSDSIPAYLAHVWAFDRLKVTEEDRKRNEMYAAERNRQDLKHGVQNLMDFISGLELKLGMDYIKEEQIPRASQLTLRTNQFNLSGKRRSEEELIDLLGTEGFRCWTIQSGDRFGDYGLVGVLIAEENGGKLILDTFLLSCRVLGREVEFAVLAALGEYCRGIGINMLEADYYPTEKNKPILDFLEKSGWKESNTASDHIGFTLAVDRIAAFPSYIGRYDSDDGKSQVAAAQDAKPHLVTQDTRPHFTAQDARPHLVTQDTELRLTAQEAEPHLANQAMDYPKALLTDENRNSWTVFLENEAALLHKCQYAPISNNTALKLLMLPVSGNVGEGFVKQEYAPPENDTQHKLVEIWRDVLKLDRPGIDDHFFKAGGHSLRAAVLVSRIHREFNIDIRLRDIFSYPTIREQSKYIANARKAGGASIQSVEKRESYPVSSVQKRLYILSQLEGSDTAYNITVAFDLYGDPDVKRLENAFYELIKRHEALRTSFDVSGGVPVQKVNETAEFRLHYFEAEQSRIDSLIKAFIMPFDLSKASLMRAGLIKLGNGRHILVIDTHHIISDGTSTAVMIGELSALYAGKGLKVLKIHYKDFSEWQSSYIKTEQYKMQGKYWTDLFSDGVPLLNMPADYPRPAVQRFEGSRLFFNAGTELSERLGTIAAEEGVTNYMLLLAAFNVLLMKYSAQEDIVVGSPVAGRPHADAEGLIGMFANTIVIRSKPVGSKTFQAFLAEVRETMLHAFENQDYQFEDLVEHLDYTAAANRNPLYDAAFVMLNMEVQPVEAEGIRFAPYSFETGMSKVDLTLAAVERNRNIYFELEFSTNLFRAETINRIKNSYMRILETVAGDRSIPLRDIELEKQDFAELNHPVDDVDFNFYFEE